MTSELNVLLLVLIL